MPEPGRVHAMATHTPVQATREQERHGDPERGRRASTPARLCAPPLERSSPATTSAG
jgi:hypothetical protein